MYWDWAFWALGLKLGCRAFSAPFDVCRLQGYGAEVQDHSSCQRGRRRFSAQRLPTFYYIGTLDPLQRFSVIAGTRLWYDLRLSGSSLTPNSPTRVLWLRAIPATRTQIPGLRREDPSRGAHDERICPAIGSPLCNGW